MTLISSQTSNQQSSATHVPLDPDTAAILQLIAAHAVPRGVLLREIAIRIGARSALEAEASYAALRRGGAIKDSYGPIRFKISNNGFAERLPDAHPT